MPHFPLLISSLRRREEVTSPEDERYGSGDKTQIEKKKTSVMYRVAGMSVKLRFYTLSTIGPRTLTLRRSMYKAFSRGQITESDGIVLRRLIKPGE